MQKARTDFSWEQLAKKTEYLSARQVYGVEVLFLHVSIKLTFKH